MKLAENIIISGEIECIGGLCIGGASAELEIGGIDKEVIKNPLTKEPYIPGSSLKGKMRSELEKRHGSKRINRKEAKEEESPQDPCGCGKKTCMTCVIFGAHKNVNAQSAPTRIIVRDAMLTEESRKKLEELQDNTGIGLEKKVENIISREAGTAGSPRTIERVPAGIKFHFEIVLKVFEGDEKEKMLSYIKEGLDAVEASYLGGGGSRGSGQVKFHYDDATQAIWKEIQK